MNSALQRLGFNERDRVLIIHADDIGMCHATLPAMAELLDFGLVSSAAVMVPCPWFPQTAALCREHPELDMGVHLTVNCEWESYRWGPISTRDPASGMIDEQGYFHQWHPAVYEHADPAAVAVELRAQVERALHAGIEPTHVDAHMGTITHPRFLPAYIDVAREYRLPVFLPRQASVLLEGNQADATVVAQTERLLDRVEAEGGVFFDAFTMLPLDNPDDQITLAKRIIDDLQPGLTMMILHPAQDTPELRAIAPDWRSRVANYAACMSTELRDYVQQSGVQVIGYRPLRELVRAQV